MGLMDVTMLVSGTLGRRRVFVSCAPGWSLAPSCVKRVPGELPSDTCVLSR